VQLGMRRPRHSPASADLVRLTAITRRHLRVIAPVVGRVLLSAPLDYLWQAGASCSELDLGYLDGGGGSREAMITAPRSDVAIIYIDNHTSLGSVRCCRGRVTGIRAAAAQAGCS
jgi:hypothetical protein